MGEKERGRGRLSQAVQADILVRREDTQTVELVVEVDFRKTKNGDLVAPHPKDLTGLLLTPTAADCHTPSNECRPRYELRDTVIVVVTAYATAQLLPYDRVFAGELFQRFHVAERGVRELCICGGATQEEVESSFQELLRSRFFGDAMGVTDHSRKEKHGSLNSAPRRARKPIACQNSGRPSPAVSVTRACKFAAHNNTQPNSL
jgi:hypothetical protein